MHSIQALLHPGEAVRAAHDVAATARVDVQAALAWRDFMVSEYSDAGQQRWLKTNGIDLLRGTGTLAGPGVVEIDRVHQPARHVVVATGSDPVLPPIPGLLELEGVWTNREATGMAAVPRRLLVLGGGPVGVELAQAVRRLGAEVVLVEGAGHVLARLPARWAKLSARYCAATASTCVVGTHATAARARRDGLRPRPRQRSRAAR